MKRLMYLVLFLFGLGVMQACHTNPLNTDKPVASEAKDTSAAWRDTNSVGTRTDR